MRKAAAAGMAFSFSAVRRPAAHDHHLLNHGSSYYRAALFTYPFAIFLILSASLQACHAQSDDASALLHIKEAVGASSPNLASWNGTLACDATSPWLGVACNRYNRVVKLNMSNFHLAGVLPPEIGLLTSLTSLDISYNSIKSPLPKTFSNLIQMHGMNLSSNAFAETFPSSIVSMTNLVELRIDNNHFSGAIPEQISQLQQIEQMWMGNNSLTSLPKSLSSLPHMSVLTAWGNALSTTLPPDWGVWVNLTYLNLHNCYLKGILPSEWGQNFTKLQRLHLYENELTGRIPESWQNMKSLQQLKMKENELTGPIPVWVGELQQRNASVDFTCNYLTGPSPSSFNSSTFANIEILRPK